MDWDGYTIFSVLTGALMVGVACIPGGKTKDRAVLAGIGVLLAGYGLYVGHQTSGSYPFPLWIFAAPFVLTGRVGLKAVERYRARQAGGTVPGATSAQDAQSAVLAPAPAPEPRAAATRRPRPGPGRAARPTGARPSPRPHP